MVSSQPFQFKTTDTTFGKVVDDGAFSSNGSFECDGSRSLKDSADNGGTPSVKVRPAASLFVGVREANLPEIPAMNRFYYLVIFTIALCTFVTFTSRNAAAQQSVYPTGLNGPSDVISGIYLGTDRGNCCWLGASGSLKISVPYGADTLLVTVFVPNYVAPKGGQSLRLQVDAAAPQQRCCFGAGQHEFAFRLPPTVREHPDIMVRLSAGATFVPKELGLNGDTRRLSFLIRGIAFFDSQTAQRVNTGPQQDLQSGPLWWLALAGIIVLALTWRRPVYGLAALIVTDPFLLTHPFHSTTITLPKVALIAVAIGLAANLRRLPTSYGAALYALLGAQTLFIASMVLSSVHAADHGSALRETLKAAQFAATLVVAYLAYRMDPDERIVRWALAIAALVVVVPALAQEFFGAPEGEIIAGHAIARIAGPLEGPNQLAGYLGIVVPVMLAFALTRPALAIERIAIALGYIACLLTFSKAGIGALAVATAVLLVIRYAPGYRRTAAALTAVLFVALLGLASASFAGVLHGPAERVFGSTNAADRFNGGLGVRSDLWHGAYEMWQEHQLFGLGPGNYELQIGRYDPGVRTHANSMYFQVLAEQGVVGFIAMLAVVTASIGVFARRLGQPLALGACMAAVAMALHQVLDCMWLYQKVGVIWWLVIAVGASAVALRERTENVAERAVA
jgi:O-antigen ligase